MKLLKDVLPRAAPLTRRGSTEFAIASSSPCRAGMSGVHNLAPRALKCQILYSHEARKAWEYTFFDKLDLKMRIAARGPFNDTVCLFGGIIEPNITKPEDAGVQNVARYFTS